MAYAMAKVVMCLCMSLLVVHVDSARMLKQVTGGIIAETSTTEETLPPPLGEASEFEANPGPAEEYNYNYSSQTTADEFGTQGGTLLDEGTEPEPTFAEEGAVQDNEGPSESFADEGTSGFLVDTQGTEESGVPNPYEFDATTQDADTMLPQEGTLDVNPSDPGFEFANAGTQDNTDKGSVFEFENEEPELGN